ncbi:MAG TPA: hypothetical protein VGV13_02255 [Methylomirabilota bacterium]|jgi:hypothetical protein|nr:hypothetical protein [Methylomirabilota bacterium]
MMPDFVPAALAFGSGIHGSASLLFRGLGQGERPRMAHMQLCDNVPDGTGVVAVEQPFTMP